MARAAAGAKQKPKGRTVSVRVPFVLAPHQARVRNAIVGGVQRIVNGKAAQVFLRFFVLVCGRRSGKTLGAVYITVEFLTTHPDAIGWWVAPTFPLTRKGMRETIHFLRQGQKHLVRAVHRSERRIEFVNGSFLEFRSAHEPDSQLVSEGLDWLVVDEAALIADPLVWSQYLRPALADRKGRALLITSPRGRNWLCELWTRGQDPLDPETLSWRLPTAAGGFVDAGELAEIKRTTPERVWQQEYLAEFLEGAGEVFRKLRSAIAPASPRRGLVVLGVDLARVRDWTVIWAGNELGEWVEWDRFQNVDWAVQKPRIVAMYKRLGASRLLMDATGMHVGADAVADELRREGLIVETVTLDGTTKRAIVENAMIRFDNAAVTVPDDPIVLDEFQRYTYTPLPSGRDRYSAPPGQHDDIVTACALYLWGIRQFAGRAIHAKRETEVQREIREALEERLGAGQDPWTY